MAEHPLAEIIEGELDRLAARRELPAAFEALFWCLYRWRRDCQAAEENDG